LDLRSAGAEATGSRLSFFSTDRPSARTKFDAKVDAISVADAGSEL
jgi:hypothetical protein